MNDVKIIGRLGADSETRFTTNGNAVTSFRLAVDKPYKKDGKWEHGTLWIPVVVWKDIELKKGDKIFVAGSINIRSWEDREGNKKITTEVSAKTIEKIEAIQEKEEPKEIPPF